MSVSRETGRGAREGIARRDSRQSRERTGSLAPYVVHVYEVRPLRRIVEHRVILLNEALADRLVRHVQRHGGGPTSCDQRRCGESQARRLMRLLSLSPDTLRKFRFDFGSYGSYEREAAPCNIPRVVCTMYHTSRKRAVAGVLSRYIEDRKNFSNVRRSCTPRHSLALCAGTSASVSLQ